MTQTDDPGLAETSTADRAAERPRLPVRASATIALLCAILGFGLVATVHTHREPQSLVNARQDDLVRILDSLTTQSDRLQREIEQLQATQQRLTTSGDQSQAALDEARREAAALGVLAGTVAASGPGIVATIDDPRHQVRSDTVLDTIEELRDAGAEAIQIGDASHQVRVVADTAFTDAGGGVAAAGTALTPPYRIVAVGDSATLAAAMRIPGGVVDSVQHAGGSIEITEQSSVTVSALRGH